jgi:hypothetical protein
METLFSFMGASERVRIVRETDRAAGIIAPVTGPDGGNVDWQNPDEVLNALNSVYAEVDSRLDEALEHAQFSTLADDW